MSINNNLVSSLNYATMQINRHGAALMLLFGTVANLINIYVLSERSLRKSPCAIYLSWPSISSLIFIWAGFLTRVLQGYDVNWPNENQIVCKIRQYILNISWTMGMWCLVGANIDRYLCSSRKNAHRQLSTNRMARYFIRGNLIFFGILFIEVIYCFEASVPSVPVACYGRNIPCRVFNDWAALSFNIILPSIFLAIFGALTIRNHRRRVVYPIINTVNPKYIRN